MAGLKSKLFANLGMNLLVAALLLHCSLALGEQACSTVSKLPASGIAVTPGKDLVTVAAPANSAPSISGVLPYELVNDGTVIRIVFHTGGASNARFDGASSALSVCAAVPSAQPSPPLPPVVAAVPTATANTFTPDAIKAAADSEKTTAATVDLSAPESPALIVLGLSPQQVVRPNTPQELVSNLLNGFDDHGNFQSGIALDFVPIQVFGGTPELGEYKDHYLTRLLNRLSVSIATVKGVSDKDPSAKLALGLRSVLWEATDPKLDPTTSSCVGSFRLQHKARMEALTASNSTIKAQDARLLLEQGRKTLYDCKQQAADQDWGSSALVVAFAPSFLSPDGSTSNLKYNGSSVWTSFAYGFENMKQVAGKAQLIFHARFRSSQQTPDPSNPGTFLTSRDAGFGGQFRVGSARFNGNFEGLVFRTWLPGKHDEYTRLAFGVDKYLVDNLWLNLAYTRTTDSSVTPNGNGVQANLKWNFNSKPQ